MKTIVLDGESLKPATLWSFARQATDPKASFKIRIAPSAKAKIQRAAVFVEQALRRAKPVYGINTGFGKFAEVVIKPQDLAKLQKNLILSHATGIGELLPRDIVMAMWLIRLNTICRGNCGVRMATVERIVRLLEAGILAEVPSRGSVGASGDLAPSAHATLALIGEGFVTMPAKSGFRRVSAVDALEALGMKPFVLEPKEGLSLINGTQLTTALALKGWDEGRRILSHADMAVAMSIETLRASHDFLDKRILESRNQPGTLVSGTRIRQWLQGPSPISKSHTDCGRVQDSYSLRCAPQVHGAVWEELDRAEDVIGREINASTDNPLLFPSTKASLSGGNFHAIYTARVSDSLASAMATLSVIAERRVALAMNPESSGLPAFLVKDGGLNSGFMMVQVTAAALASEAKSLCFPASVDSIPTSADREDHVSMGPNAGHKLLQVVNCARGVVAIELMCAAQGLDLLKPLKPNPRLRESFARIRKKVRFLDVDRVLSHDIQALEALVLEEEV